MLRKLFNYYLLPSLVVLIACIQLYRTETTQQSRWKGGGFGMYTSINESIGIIVINEKKYTPDMLKDADASKKFHLEKDLLYSPSKKHMTKFYHHLADVKDTTLIQVFQPAVDLEHNTISYQLVYEQVFTLP